MGNRFRFMAFAAGLFVLAGTISIHPSHSLAEDQLSFPDLG